jgi:hypothetical protein
VILMATARESAATVMLKLPVPLLPAASVALMLTVVVPMGKVLPLACE